MITVKPCNDHYYYDGWDGAEEIDAWTGGPLHAEGLVLVDAATLRGMIESQERQRVLAVDAREDQRTMVLEADRLRAALTKSAADEASLRKRWAALGTIHRDERAYRQELEVHIAKVEARLDALTLDRDRWGQRSLGHQTVLTMSGETGQDRTDECECGGKMWCLACQQSAWPSRADDCLAPTPEAP